MYKGEEVIEEIIQIFNKGIITGIESCPFSDDN